MGEPILQLPQDMFASQDFIYNTKPEYILEVGVAWGGSLLFYSTLLTAFRGKKVIGIDIYIPEDINEKLKSFHNISKRIVLINGSSVEESTVKKVKNIIGNSKNNGNI